MKDKDLQGYVLVLSERVEGLNNRVLELEKLLHTHNPSKISGICKDCGEQLMPEEVFND